MSWRARWSGASGVERLLFAAGLFAVLTVTATPSAATAAQCPNVHVVLDRSGSMTSAMAGGGTRWSAATQTINKLVGLADPLRWLAHGWRDFRAAPGIGLFYGACFWAMAALLDQAGFSTPQVSDGVAITEKTL